MLHDTVNVGAIGQCRFTLSYLSKSSGQCLLSLLATGGTSVILIPVSVLGGLEMYYILDEWYF
jgi:hypothetical protein